MTNTLSAPAIIRNVERYLAQQYAKREVVQRHPADCRAMVGQRHRWARQVRPEDGAGWSAGWLA